MIEEKMRLIQDSQDESQDESQDKTNYRIIDFNGNHLVFESLKETLEKFEYLQKSQNVWLDFQAITKEEAKIIEEYFLIHPLTIEDILINDSGEKLDTFSDYNHISMQIKLEDGIDEVEYIHIIQKQKFVLTFHRNYFKNLFRISIGSSIYN